MRNLRLHVVGIAAVHVAVIADVSTIECIHEAERTVVDCQPKYRHVVGVEHPMAESDALPLCHQTGGTARYLFKERQVRLLRSTAIWIEPRKHVVGKLPECVVLLRPVEILERTEADEGGGHAQRNRRSFDGFAKNRVIGADYRQRSRRWDP